MDGFFLIDKRKGETSFDVVKRVRKFTGMRKVGHAGTLDPLASGLMLVAVGEGTKLLEYLVLERKRYVCEACFGVVSDTYDAEGKLEFSGKEPDFSLAELEKTIEKKFLGKIYQRPPKYSALKVGGKRAYALARAGKELDLPLREVEVFEFEVENFALPRVNFDILCSKGTYIRSLIHDLGVVMGCNAYVSELRRTEIGDFRVEDAADEKIISLEELALRFSHLNLSDEEFAGLSDGRIYKNKKIDQDVDLMAFYKGNLLGVIESAGLDGGIKLKKMIVRD